MNGHELRGGQAIAIDGSTGAITLDDVPLVTPEITEEFRTVLGWADELRRLDVRANADAPADAARARSFGAQGIGLCRTEHMFFGADRDRLVKDMFVAAEEWRRAHVEQGRIVVGHDAPPTPVDDRFRSALAALQELQRADFEGIFREMTGLPVTIRLLDPPLHEFLPVEHFQRELEELESKGAADEEIERARHRLALVHDLHEANPMLGTRGSRLAILYPPHLRDAGEGDHPGGGRRRGDRGEAARRDHAPADRVRDRAGARAGDPGQGGRTRRRRRSGTRFPTRWGRCSSFRAPA